MNLRPVFGKSAADAAARDARAKQEEEEGCEAADLIQMSCATRSHQ